MQYRLFNRTADAAVIVLEGDFDALGASAIRSVFETLAAADEGNVVIDMSRVDFMDSSGVGALVFLYKRLVAAGRSLELVGVEGQPQDLINMLRIDKVIAVNCSMVVFPSQSAIAAEARL